MNMPAIRKSEPIIATTVLVNIIRSASVSDSIRAISLPVGLRSKKEIDSLRT